MLLLLLRCRFFIRQRADCHIDWVVIEIVCLGMIKFKSSGEHASLDDNVTVLLNGIEEKAFDTALVQNHLLEPTNPGDGVGNTVRSSNPALLIWVPETNLDHVVGFAPYAVCEIERVEDFQRSALQAVCLAVEDLHKISTNEYE